MTQNCNFSFFFFTVRLHFKMVGANFIISYSLECIKILVQVKKKIRCDIIKENNVTHFKQRDAHFYFSSVQVWLLSKEHAELTAFCCPHINNRYVAMATRVPAEDYGDVGHQCCFTSPELTGVETKWTFRVFSGMHSFVQRKFWSDAFQTWTYFSSSCSSSSSGGKTLN